MLTFIKKILQRYPQLNRIARLAVYKLKVRTIVHPKWKKILEEKEWKKVIAASHGGKKVLVATSLGAHFTGSMLESFLCVALSLRGAEVHVLLCDSALPACLLSDITWHPDVDKFIKDGPKKDFCGGCFGPAKKMFDEIGVVVHRYSDYLTNADRERAQQIAASTPIFEIEDYKWDNLSVGEHAMAGALRFFARASLSEEPKANGILRRYFEASLITTFAMQRMFATEKYSDAVFHHGIYVPQGLIGEVARRNNIHVVNWNPAYRKHCFIFSHKDTYHHTLMDESTDRWENMKLSKSQEIELDDYLKSRWVGSQDWIWFHEQPQFKQDAIRKEIGIDLSKPTIGMLTNVMWDAQLHYPANAFKTMLEWVFETIEYFKKRPDLQLLIRVHPAEIRGALKSRQPICNEISSQFPQLPPNVFIIPPESRISTYAAMMECNSVIIYGTKTGVELTSMGIPVIVAGEAWVRNKGFTVDIGSRGEYFKVMDRLPFSSKMSEKDIKRARLYAFHFFFRRMIPLKYFVPSKNRLFKISIKHFDELKPGKSKGLDVVCDGILNQSDFIYPYEVVGPS